MVEKEREDFPMFNFENEMELLGLSEIDYNDFKENEAENFSQYDEEMLQKIYILQEKTLVNMKEIGLANPEVLADAMTNLVFNL